MLHHETAFFSGMHVIKINDSFLQTKTLIFKHAARLFVDVWTNLPTAGATFHVALPLFTNYNGAFLLSASENALFGGLHHCYSAKINRTLYPLWTRSKQRNRTMWKGQGGKTGLGLCLFIFCLSLIMLNSFHQQINPRKSLTDYPLLP